MDHGAFPSLSTIGYLTLTTKTSALLVLFYQGLLRSFGHFNHDEMLGVYYLIILAFPVAMVSVDCLPGRREKTGVCLWVSHPVDVAADGLGLL